MTIHIGRTFAVAVIVVLLIAAAAAVGYKVGGDRKDEAGAGAVKAAEARAFERGRAKGDAEGRQVWADMENSQEEADDDVIKYLGYDRSDWKKNHWYLIGVTTRGGDGDPKYVSVFDRKLMSPGLDYSLCGEDNSSICYVEQ